MALIGHIHFFFSLLFNILCCVTRKKIVIKIKIIGKNKLFFRYPTAFSYCTYRAPYHTPLCHNTSFDFHFVAFFAFFFTHELSRNVSARYVSDLLTVLWFPLSSQMQAQYPHQPGYPSMPPQFPSMPSAHLESHGDRKECPKEQSM